ncbi:MAG: hypothetical protein OIF32_09090 [Campylobacterales bacterium]|nr:hypothetical protein [Campylobacterales bacterium]
MKAKNIEEIYHIFDGQKFLTEKEKEFYVDTYSNILKDFQLALQINQNPKKTFFVAGQSGNGKSTALNYMPVNNEKINEKFKIVNIEAKDFFQYEYVDIMDILLTIGIVLIEGEDELEKEFLKELEEYKEEKLGTLKKENIEIEADKGSNEASIFTGMKVNLLSLFSSGAEFKSRYLSERETRESVQKVFKADKKKITDIINTLIRKYHQKNQDRKVLLVIDGLERKDNIEHIFSDDLYVFDEIECEKIITIPVNLATKKSFVEKKVINFNLKISDNPFGESSNQQATTNYNHLKEVVFKRLESKDLITEKAVEKAVDYSGGNLRQLVRIIHESALKALSNESQQIDLFEVENVIEELRSQFSMSLVGRVDVLEHVRNNNMPLNEKEDKFIASIKDNMIFAYFNGSVWYEVNPIVKKTVELYAKNTPTI